MEILFRLFQVQKVLLSDGDFPSYCLIFAPASSSHFLTLADPVHNSPMSIPAHSFWCISMNLHDLHCLDRQLYLILCVGFLTPQTAAPSNETNGKLFPYLNIFVRFLPRVCVWFFPCFFFLFCDSPLPPPPPMFNY